MSNTTSQRCTGIADPRKTTRIVDQLPDAWRLRVNDCDGYGGESFDRRFHLRLNPSSCVLFSYYSILLSFVNTDCSSKSFRNLALLLMFNGDAAPTKVVRGGQPVPELLGFRCDKRVTDAAVIAGCGLRQWNGFAMDDDWHAERVVSAIRSSAQDPGRQEIVGLLDALDKFDSSKDIKFRSYEQFRICGAILDSLRTLDWSSRELRRKARAVEDAIQVLTAQCRRSPTETEIAQQLHIDLGAYQHLLGETEGP